MMIELFESQKRAVLPLFLENPRHRIACACAMGYTPCRVFADDPHLPSAAIVVLSHLGVGFATGNPEHAVELLEMLRGWHPWFEINDPPKSWHPALAAFSKESHAAVRYWFAENNPYNIKQLEALAKPPIGCSLVPYDRVLLELALASKWSEDQIGAFSTQEAFLQNGYGIALMQDDKLLAGCSSFVRYPDGYEIQIDTHPDARGKGYAACVGAAFILAARARGYASYWDAANHASLRLAEKLGFKMTEAFMAWMLIAKEDRPKALLS